MVIDILRLHLNRALVMDGMIAEIEEVMSATAMVIDEIEMGIEEWLIGIIEVMTRAIDIILVGVGNHGRQGEIGLDRQGEIGLGRQGGIGLGRQGGIGHHDGLELKRDTRKMIDM